MNEMAYLVNDIIRHFDIEFETSPYGNGHINDTYVTGCKPRYILQRINSNVFKNPAQVMENIAKVCDFLREKIKAEGGDPDRETLTLMRTVEGKEYHKENEQDYFRVYKFIEDSISLDTPENTDQFYNAALAFGKFQRLLSDFPASELHETIKDFHHTPKRFDALEAAIEADVCGRRASVEKEIEFARAHKGICSLIVDGIADGSIPLRVTHNDTKLNNVMLDAETGKGLCVIDLDTVMPGSLLYDFGDAIRAGANKAAEDETNLDLVGLNVEMFEAFARGFCEELGESFTEREIELLAMSAIILTFECGIRFLTDYLSGDTYFKIHRPEHNLDRARDQFKLVYDMEQKLDEMNATVRKVLGR
ncbi:MAG: aminoglycoside phosphotransferase family protein [Clostridia bacterium]|nr:aminoglycoside phosphotransferase family protein [Clostridia bacterium]